MPKQIPQHELDAILQTITRFAEEAAIEVVETEIMSLHEGNIAGYRLRPSEYQTWQGAWNSAN